MANLAALHTFKLESVGEDNTHTPEKVYILPNIFTTLQLIVIQLFHYILFEWYGLYL